MRKNLIMKLYLLLFLTTTFAFSQVKDCNYEIEEKTDSTTIKIVAEKIIYEKTFGASKKFIQFTPMQIDGTPTLKVQIVEKNTAFIPAKCFDLTSKLLFQLENGKFVVLKSITENACSILNYNKEDQSNIRILEGYFIFTKPNYEMLKMSPISIMRLQFVGEKEDYNIKNELISEINQKTTQPSNFFINNLKCIE